MKTYQVDKNGYYGEFGGAYIPEILHQCVENLQNIYLEVLESESFKQEFNQLLRDYVGRPSPLYLAKRLSEKYGCKIYLKREDLNHTGAHKINNVLGQCLLAKRMHHRRNRCGTARCCHSYRLRPDEHGMHRLHGQDGRGTPACQRAEDGDARCNRRPCYFRQHDPERCNKRSNP